MMARAVAISGLAAIGLTGCASPEPRFRLANVLRLEDALVNIVVEASGDGAEENAAAFAECAASQYALDHGFRFARHIRTNRTKTGGVWRADAVYTISTALPPGSRTIDAEVVVANCAEMGLQTG